MNEFSYSVLSRKIHLHLKDEGALRDDFLKLIEQSFQWIEKEAFDRSIALHNKYVELGRVRYGPQGIWEYAFDSDLKKLKLDFERDPSDMGIVMRLAIEYSKVGLQNRATQLMSRVAASGYAESAAAAKLLERLSAGEALK